MKRNVGITDKAIRIILALFFITLYLTHVVTGTWGIALLVIAAILAVTSFVGFCPIYSIFGIDSRRLKAK